MRDEKEIIKALLEKRGIVSPDEVEEFLSQKPQKTYDPFLLFNMKAGVDLLLSEIEKGNKICIYGDYDADGVTSVCILTSVLRNLTDNLFYYIPSRFIEGYGPNKDAFKKIKDRGASLVITVDCGSVSYDEIEYGKSLGLKFIVTDHHRIDSTRADCIIINPKQQECEYPFKELAGCGVAFKFAQGIQRTLRLPSKVLHEVLDYVAIGTVGDIVSLTGENRTLVKYGLMKIQDNPRIAVKTLLEMINIKTVNSESIAFGIAPHINAAGRMASAGMAVELLMSEDTGTITDNVSSIIDLNRERKKKQEEAYNECLKMLEGDERFIILHVDDIHEGIAGIVAGKIKETFNRPVIILTKSEDGMLKGTGRSIWTVDLFKLLNKHNYLFERFGGHKGACGFSLKADRLDELRSIIYDEINRMYEENTQLFMRETKYDLVLEPGEITELLVEELKMIEPCGEGNERPRFKLEGITIDRPIYMGEEKKHFKFYLSMVECVLFKYAEQYSSLISSHTPVDIIGALYANEWRGRKRLQFIIDEIEVGQNE